MGKQKVNTQWVRVRRTEERPEEKKRRERNSGVFASQEFKDGCREAGIEVPTKRQASKWARGVGVAREAWRRVEREKKMEVQA